MEDSLGLVGKRVLLLLGDSASAAAAEPDQAVWNRDWLRGTVRAAGGVGAAAAGSEASGGEGAVAGAAMMTVSVSVVGVQINYSVV